MGLWSGPALLTMHCTYLLQVAAQHGIQLFSSIRDALTLGGKGSAQVRGATEGSEVVELGVAAVLLIGEHGDVSNLCLCSALRRVNLTLRQICCSTRRPQRARKWCHAEHSSSRSWARFWKLALRSRSVSLRPTSTVVCTWRGA